MTTIRVMTGGDLPLGMRLKGAANWNQTEADWRRFLALEPGGCFVAEHDGELAGTLVTTVFGPVAWISMVLVDERMRGKGMGTALMRHALDELDRRGIPTVRLDATPMGRPLYEKLGFAGDFALARYEGTPSAAPPAGGVQPYAPERMGGVARLDAELTGTDRAKLLRALVQEGADETRVVAHGGEVVGYLIARPGTRAWHVGPCLAADEAAGRLLLADAFRRHAGQRVLVDIPEGHAAARAQAEAAGLAVQRPFLRMSRGPRPVERPEAIWASSGPEKG